MSLTRKMACGMRSKFDKTDITGIANNAINASGEAGTISGN